MQPDRTTWWASPQVEALTEATDLDGALAALDELNSAGSNGTYVLEEHSDAPCRYALTADTLPFSVESDSLWAMFQYLWWEIAEKRIMEECWTFHSAVAFVGSTIVIMGGKTQSGKSTAAAYLSTIGDETSGIITDEMLIIDPQTHDVLPYCRPIVVRQIAGIHELSGCEKKSKAFDIVVGDENERRRETRYLFPLPTVREPSALPFERGAVFSIRYNATAEGVRCRPMRKEELLVFLLQNATNSKTLNRNAQMASFIASKCVGYHVEYSSLTAMWDTVVKIAASV